MDAERALEQGRGSYARRDWQDAFDAIARRQGSEALMALADHAEGTVALAEGDVPAALPVLRRAWQAWQELDAPYDAARARVLISQACAGVGDEDTAGSSWTLRATSSFGWALRRISRGSTRSPASAGAATTG